MRSGVGDPTYVLGRLRVLAEDDFMSAFVYNTGGEGESFLITSLGRVLLKHSFSILVHCRRSSNVSIGLDEASCPGRRASPGINSC